ncbi:hypothetical protein AB0395_00330 [Streptosporangium sp. NPDC051023]|uniref:hypothetical protein n=1 Tax=Streptosporangium sp. NPDC051023 TaxID=3155410 RepID=UPI00344D14A2
MNTAASAALAGPADGRAVPGAMAEGMFRSGMFRSGSVKVVLIDAGMMAIEDEAM